MNPALVIERLVIGFGSTALCPALSATWTAGCVVVMAANGRGKTTLLRTITGLLPPLAGAVHIAGHDLRARPLAAKAHLGWMPDRLPVPGTTTPADLFAPIAWAKGLRGADHGRLIATWSLERIMQRPLGVCSLGQQRRSCLAAAMIGDPLVVLLDEPTVGLDAAGQQVFIDLLRERSARGLLSVVSTHDADLPSLLGAELVRLADTAHAAGDRLITSASPDDHGPGS